MILAHWWYTACAIWPKNNVPLLRAFSFCCRRGAFIGEYVGRPAQKKQSMDVLDGVPGGISQTYEDWKVIGGRGLEFLILWGCCSLPLPKNLHSYDRSSASGKFVEEHRVKHLNSLNQILRLSSGTGILEPTRRHIQDESRNHLSGRVMTTRVTSKRGDLYIPVWMRIHPVEANILKNSPKIRRNYNTGIRRSNGALEATTSSPLIH